MTPVNFIKLNPTENMTILVRDKIERKAQGDIARRLLDYGNVFAEQVGFIENPQLSGARARLQMMGGEFCGNATMSLAALLARDMGLAPGESAVIPLEVSGADGLCCCEITVMDGYYTGRVNMPLPYAILETEYGWLVKMPGISHLIVDAKDMLLNKEAFAEEAINNFVWKEALGIMFLTDGYMEPFVFVKSAGTKIWERCCASGSAALAAYTAFNRHSDVEMEISQPGGRLKAFAGFTGSVTELWIQGTVRIAAEGTAYV